MENSFSVRREQPGRGKAPAVFFVAPREAITWHYERYRDATGQADPSGRLALLNIVKTDVG